ncbi:hypothetical protein A6E13_10050 [Aliivibrio fischeri]|uniref:YadA C-terminal domain-containing protein n=1 Tax=Aliivibrio fischeri TaxID=668 RepID=UPI00080DEAA0|nr:YadA C-terminal domain-containing protein [Aliivibrio fischeri]OCH24989.1 hypothetical protein A6E13_10050 [Aliivibrio fischeri]
MKKSILALSVLSVLSFGASAENDINSPLLRDDLVLTPEAKQEFIAKITTKIKEHNEVGINPPQHGINPPNEGDLPPVRDDLVLTPEAKQELVEKITTKIKERNEVGINPPQLGINPPSEGDLPPIHKDLKQVFQDSDTSNKVDTVNNLIERSGRSTAKITTNANGDYVLTHKGGATVITEDNIQQLAEKTTEIVKAGIAERRDDNPVMPPVEGNPEDMPVVGDSQLRQHAQSQTAQLSMQQANIDTNAANIDELFNITADLREDLELQGARNMAAISARAFTTEEGEFSVGVGLGGSGSENAMAIGGAYQINANWSVNTTIAFDTGSNADYGVGAHYSW